MKIPWRLVVPGLLATCGVDDSALAKEKDAKPVAIPLGLSLTLRGLPWRVDLPQGRPRSSITIVRDKDFTHTHRDADLDAMVAPGDVVTVEESFF